MKANGKLFALTRIKEYFDSKETRNSGTGVFP